MDRQWRDQMPPGTVCTGCCHLQAVVACAESGEIAFATIAGIDPFAVKTIQTEAVSIRDRINVREHTCLDLKLAIPPTDLQHPIVDRQLLQLALATHTH